MRLAATFASAILSAFLFTNQAFAFSSQEDNISVGHNPIGIAINPNTNKIYVTNSDSNSLSVIDGLTNKVIANITVEYPSEEVVVNPNTNKIYLIHGGTRGSTLAVIDGSTETLTDILEIRANGIALNPATNKIYLMMWNHYGLPGDQSVYGVHVVDGVTNKIAGTIGNATGLMAVDPKTNKLYVTNGNQIFVIDGKTNQVITSFDTGYHRAEDIIVNPNTDKVYVLNSDFPSLSTGTESMIASLLIIEASTHRIAANITLGITPVGLTPGGLALNPLTNDVYVSHFDGNSAYPVISVIDGLSDTIINKIKISKGVGRLAFSPNTNKVYMINTLSDSLSVISDVETNLVKTKEFTVSSSLDGKNYTITGTSESVKVISFKIYPKQAIDIQVDAKQERGGEVQLTLPKNMIDGIRNISALVEDYSQAIDFQQISSNSSSTTIKFVVPKGAYKVEIEGTTVVPEFPVGLMVISVAIGVMLSTVAVIGRRRGSEFMRDFE